FNCCARRFQFGRVNRDPDFVSVTLFNCRARDRAEFLDRLILIDDVPDLYQIRFLRRELADELARLIRGFDLHYWWIAEIEFFARYTGNQRPRDCDSWSSRGPVRFHAHLEIPHRPSDIDHARYPATNVTGEYVVQMRFDPGDLVLVGANAVE